MSAEVHLVIEDALRGPAADGDDDDGDAAHVSAPSHPRSRALQRQHLSDEMVPTTAGSGHHNPQLLAEALSRATLKTAEYSDLTLGTLALER